MAKEHLTAEEMADKVVENAKGMERAEKLEYFTYIAEELDSLIGDLETEIEDEDDEESDPGEE